MIAEEIGVSCVDLREIVHGFQEHLDRKERLASSDIGSRIINSTYRGFHNFAQLRPSGLHNGLEVFQSLFSLLLYTSIHNQGASWIERDTTRAEEQISDFDCLRIRTDSRWGLCHKVSRLAYNAVVKSTDD